jgi:hypothetical protein
VLLILCATVVWTVAPALVAARRLDRADI